MTLVQKFSYLLYTGRHNAISHIKDIIYSRPPIHTYTIAILCHAHCYEHQKHTHLPNILSTMFFLVGGGGWKTITYMIMMSLSRAYMCISSHFSNKVLTMYMLYV